MTQILNLKRRLTMRQVSLYLDADDLERIGKYSVQYQAKQSEMIRELLRLGIDALDRAAEEAEQQDAETLETDSLADLLDDIPVAEPAPEPPTEPRSRDALDGLSEDDARQLGAVQAGVPLDAVAAPGWDQTRYPTAIDQLFAEQGIRVIPDAK
jgi:hypothetical protein